MAAFRFSIGFLGCRANEVEADALRSALLAAGGCEAAAGEPPDVVVLNTCAVTASAQAQSRNGLRRARRAAGEGLVIVTGCAAQLDPDELAALPGADIVVGNRHKALIGPLLQRLAASGGLGIPPGPARAAALAEALEAVAPVGPAGGSGQAARRGAPVPSEVGGRVAGTSAHPLVCWTPDPSADSVVGRSGPIPRTRTRPSIKIQDGCSFHCTYCIVAALRGRPVSRPPADIVAEAGRLVSAGFREVTLTGINLGLYGLHAAGSATSAAGAAGAASAAGATGVSASAAGADAGPPVPPGADGDPAPLGELLAELARVAGLERIRLSSLEPMTITPGLLDRIAALPQVAHSFHVPVQSGDDGVLRRMGRPYRAADLEALAARIAERFPVCGFGVDVLAGFPGETPEAFARTLALLERLPVTYLHAFAYSERPGTPAAELTPRVPVPERRERVARLRELDAGLRVRFHRRLSGQRCRLVIERVQDGHFTGMSGEYVRMTGRAIGLAPGDWVDVIAGRSLEPGRQHCRMAEGA